MDHGAVGVPTGSVHNARPCERCRYRVSGRVARRFLTVAPRLTNAEQQSRRRVKPHQRAPEADCGAILKAMLSLPPARAAPGHVLDFYFPLWTASAHSEALFCLHCMRGFFKPLSAAVEAPRCVPGAVSVWRCAR
jgi:hypothetical protein